jgi:hypothetical protein
MLTNPHDRNLVAIPRSLLHDDLQLTFRNDFRTGILARHLGQRRCRMKALAPIKGWALNFPCIAQIALAMVSSTEQDAVNSYRQHASRQDRQHIGALG